MSNLHNKYSNIFFAFTILGIVMFMVGCQSVASPTQSTAVITPETPQKQFTIGVSLLTRTHVYYNLLEQYLNAEANKLGWKLIVVDGQQDVNVQTSQIQDFITQKVDAIIVSPASNSGLSNAIDLANAANIPVFTMDSVTDGNVTAHVGTDNFKGGQLAGEYMGKLLNGKGTVAIVEYSEIQVCVDREDGFRDVIQKQFPGITIVDAANCSGDENKAASVTQDMLIKHPDLTAIFAVGDPFALGALSSIQAAKMNVLLVGYDANPEGIAEIKKGDVWKADVAQDPHAVATTVLDLINQKLAGKVVAKTTLIAPYMVDITNAK